MGARPFLIGLTGGLASGKSTVARLLEARGVPLLDADREVHRLYRPGAAGAVAVARLFGARVLAADGSVDRDALARRVVADGEALARLNGAVHPLVRAAVEGWVAELGRLAEPPPLAVVEAALLVETGAAGDYDLLVVVWCTAAQQLERALARGMSGARARALIGAQLPIDAKRAAADVVIDNSGPPGALAAEVDRAWREVLELCAARRK
ncbi:MAG TPA: dephospho-CoA kinase [Thermoanaerobaculales bacterium]|nr:dephospho-CoA kinase [Thermoanaerobaculales bacterium]HQL28648.1 dephospho-CoA kinase [Thermoanaerobaculales bacterium]